LTHVRRAAALLVLLLGACLARAEPIAVEARGVFFNPDDPSQLRAGALQWVAGIALSAAHPRFGGWSGLTIAPDGKSLVAVSDVGQWLVATLVHDAKGHVTGLTRAEIGPLLDFEGAPLQNKLQADAEALARDRDGGLIVAFEGIHRLWRYQPGDRPLEARPTRLPTPPLLRRAPRNAGVEAMTVLADGRLVMLTEDFRNPAGDLVGWLRDEEGWHELALAPTGQFKPTDLTQLPNGDLVLLERRFTMIGGVAARLQRIPLTEVKPGARLEGRELAELIPPMTVDNMEGLAAVRAADGSTLIYVLSDDNFSPIQRTLLLQFRLIEP
jgi:hypothetical protein